MRQSILFLFIQRVFLRSDQNQGRNRFQYKTSQEEKNYLLYELDVKTPVVFKDSRDEYELTDHHLSFYEYEDPRDPNLSEYHYTAKFRTKNKLTYRVHVYFNGKDQLVEEPVVSIMKDSSTFQYVGDTDNELKARFTQLAIDECSAVMVNIRKQFRKGIEEFKTRYKNIEIRLCELSKNLTSNQQQYIDLLQEALRAVGQLAIYSNEEHFKWKHKLLTQLQHKIIAITSSENSDTDEDEEDTKPQRQANRSRSTHSEVTRVVTPKRQLLRPILTQLLSENNQYRNEKTTIAFATKVANFLSLHAKVQEAVLTSDDSNYIVTTQDLQELQNLATDVTNEGSVLAREALLKSDFTTAASLARFYYPMPEDLLRIALASGNHEMLSFLLKHGGDFPVNTVLINDTATPVVFCLQTNNPRFPKTKCLDVLIKYGASLLVPATDGLPVAFHILSEKGHPLKEAILSNLAITLNNTAFRQALISKLALSLQNDLPEAIKEKICKMVSQLQKTITHGSQLDLKHMSAGELICLRTYQLFDTASKYLLDTDAEVLEAHERLKSACDDFVAMLTPLEKRNFLVNSRKEVEIDVETAKSMQMQFSSSRQNILQTAENRTEYFQLVAQSYQLQQLLKKNRNGMVNRERLQAANKINEIDARVRILDKELEGIKTFYKKDISPTQRSHIEKINQEESELLHAFVDKHRLQPSAISDEQYLQEFEKIKAAVLAFDSALCARNIGEHQKCIKLGLSPDAVTIPFVSVVEYHRLLCLLLNLMGWDVTLRKDNQLVTTKPCDATQYTNLVQQLDETVAHILLDALQKTEEYIRLGTEATSSTSSPTPR